MPNTSRKSKSKEKYKYNKSKNQLRQKSSFLGTIRFKPAIPPVPLEPKQLSVASSSDQYVDYSTTSLEKQYTRALLSEPTLGIPIELIDPSVYEAPEGEVPLEDADLALVQDDDDTNIYSGQGPAVSWLRRTQYIAAEEKMPSTSKKQSTPAESTQPTAKKELSQKELGDKIDETFIEAKALDDKETLKHPTNSKLEATSVLPVFPNFDLEENVYMAFHFDSDPLPKRLRTKDNTSYYGAIAKENTSRYGATGKKKPNNTTSTYFTPKGDYSQLQIGEALEYSELKDYTMQPSTNIETGAALQIKEDGVYFNRIQQRFVMKKRQESKEGRVVVVQCRDFNEDEENDRRAQRERLEE
eukprot:gb/GECH01000643.1/.p1 GENE.gb/GECH01000643.1/~~gb/GECH01000643.1/.p1  ORF type:complete len:356 (+),score=112.48 gb/GECH01000643.1/:1-1068(+)